MYYDIYNLSFYVFLYVGCISLRKFERCMYGKWCCYLVVYDYDYGYLDYDLFLF